MAGEFNIELIGVEEAKKRFSRLSASLDMVPLERTKELLEALVELLAGEVAERTPQATGALANSITGDVRFAGVALEGLVSSSLNYATPIELGRQPGSKPPPYKALLGWVKRKLDVDDDEAVGVAIATAKNIGKWGFLTLKHQDKQQMFRDAWRENAPVIRRFLEEIGVHVSEELLKEL